MNTMRNTLNTFDAVADFIRENAATAERPFVVALDGRSGAGKSTLAMALAAELGAAVIEGDEFYAGGVSVRADSAADRAAACIDWTRIRFVLDALRANRAATWRAFDWDAFDGRLRTDPTVLIPRPVIILEGVYSARPELTDLIDLKLSIEIDERIRAARLLGREGCIGPWERQWHEAEDHYLVTVMPPTAFDAILDGAAMKLPEPHRRSALRGPRV